MLTVSAICIVNGCLIRYLYSIFISSKSLDERILILGGGEFAKQTAQLVLSRRDLKRKIIGFLDQNRSRIGMSLINPTILGLYEDVYPLSKKYDVDRIVVAIEDRRGNLPMNGLMECKLQGIHVEDAIHFYERLSGKLFVENLTPGNLIFSDGFCVTPAVIKIKRIVDTALSMIMLFITLPITLLIAFFIKLESRGPAIFKQERVGENGNIFQIYKFRTMNLNAEEKSGPTWALKNDPRITRIGQLLRKTRLDEIPQLINVLKGDMSFVGPRPERPYFVEQLTKVIPYYLLRTAIRPGITGWAQIKYKYGDSIDDAKEKLRYDLYYIKNMSVALDFSILWQTVKVVLFGEGAQ
jgi:sugar transferase (PEP-CTERM system associated)